MSNQPLTNDDRHYHVTVTVDNDVVGTFMEPIDDPLVHTTVTIARRDLLRSLLRRRRLVVGVDVGADSVGLHRLFSPAGAQMVPGPAVKEENPPPVAKYTATIKISANNHGELLDRVRSLANNWWHHHAEYGKRDAVNSTDGTTNVKLEHTNPEQTPEKYTAELDAWWEREQVRWKTLSTDVNGSVE